MSTASATPKTIDEYIEGFPEDVQDVLQKVRLTIRKAAANAEETISYAIPTFKLNGKYLIYFAGYKRHVGIYPVPKGDDEMNRKLAPFVTGKGTVRLPLDKPIPYELVTEMTKCLMLENISRSDAKAKKNADT